ncbi:MULTISPECIES: thioredoxin family protein [Thioclava]|uniref:thioredoxin family protein n=1 Tax=Thioclava TaxID=285107 RepID=UPI0023A90869|nr:MULTISPECIES: thioredoxin family protein [Thioclava]|tara:strand:- start:908 stop:1384 length:477 start_codon:yes stop_codon:yes gene_type:complete
MFSIVWHTISMAAALAVTLSATGLVAHADTASQSTDAASSATPATETTDAQAESEFRLLMVEQVGCVYCRMWNNDLAPIYPKTPEGKTAPLQRVDLHKPFPDDITITGGKPLFTPTFILLQDGVEVARIEGYASEDFFWGLLDQALKKNGATYQTPSN